MRKEQVRVKQLHKAPVPSSNSPRLLPDPERKATIAWENGTMGHRDVWTGHKKCS